ncbi:MAG: hypothetical protein DLM50_03785 [Candidatus Meridianibacter frigidus]|nr:MAG: hypothetical protein DLM50_03785 [Candidatus Eremiobacteraeota bacterium]
MGLAFCAADPTPPDQAVSRTLSFSADDAAARIFVYAPGARPGTGENGIVHAADLRQAADSDRGSQSVYAADGTNLFLSLDKWRAAQGTAEITNVSDTSDKISLKFTNLIAFGVYSAFLADLENPGTTLRPIDGKGSANSFTAAEDGTASLDATAPVLLASTQALVLIYHSDGIDHGPGPGAIGTDAHEQIIAPL